MVFLARKAERKSPRKSTRDSQARAPGVPAAYQFKGSARPLQDRGGDGVWLIELGEVAGTGDDPDLGLAGDALREFVCVAARHDPVLLAPQQQRRCRDQRQPLFELGVAERPKDTRRRLAGAGLLDRPFRRVL